MAISVSVQTKQKRGNGLWKLNTSHLASSNDKEAIKKCIIQTLQRYPCTLVIYMKSPSIMTLELVISDSLFYETLSVMILGETIKYSKQKSREKRTEETRL